MVSKMGKTFSFLFPIKRLEKEWKQNGSPQHRFPTCEHLLCEGAAGISKNGISKNLRFHVVHSPFQNVECFYRNFKGSFKDVYIADNLNIVWSKMRDFIWGDKQVDGLQPTHSSQRRHFYWALLVETHKEGRRTEGEKRAFSLRCSPFTRYLSQNAVKGS